MSFAPSRRQATGAESLEMEVGESFDLYPNGKPCFFCSRILGDAADDHTVFWGGHGGQLFLHPKCAIELGKHLIKDGMIADSISTLDPLFRGTPWFDPKDLRLEPGETGGSQE